MKFKVSYFAIGISIMCFLFGVQQYYSNIDLQNQYNHISNQMTEAQQMYSQMGLHDLRMGDGILFAAGIIMGVFAVVGYFWFDRPTIEGVKQ